MILFFAWVGAVLVSTAPYLIDTPFGKWLAIVGIVCLTIQAIDLKAFNLIAMNTVAIGGYIYVLYF